MKYDSKIWGPHYWFFLHTIAYKYPDTPNENIKRKYYDLLINFPLFIPDEKIGKEFALLLDKYPFVPYLDRKESLIIWVNFIHNKINILLKKPEVPLLDSFDNYILYYKNNITQNKEIEKVFYLDLVVYFILILLICFLIYYLTNFYKIEIFF